MAGFENDERDAEAAASPTVSAGSVGDRATDADFGEVDGADDDRGENDVMGAGSHRNLPGEAFAEATADSVTLASRSDGTASPARSGGED